MFTKTLFGEVEWRGKNESWCGLYAILNCAMAQVSHRYAQEPWRGNLEDLNMGGFESPLQRATHQYAWALKGEPSKNKHSFFGKAMVTRRYSKMVTFTRETRVSLWWDVALEVRGASARPVSGEYWRAWMCIRAFGAER